MASLAPGKTGSHGPRARPAACLPCIRSLPRRPPWPPSERAPASACPAGPRWVPAAPALARTLTVSRSAPADFTNIQAALDAAAPGDSILIQSGIYAATTQRYADGSLKQAVGWVEKPLTILGDGTTRIQAGTQSGTWAFFSELSDSLAFSNLTIQHMDSGIRVEGPTRVADCRFLDLDSGLLTGTSPGRLWIRDCQFDQMHGLGVHGLLDALVDMRGCQYTAQPLVDTAVFLNYGARAHVQNCAFRFGEVMEVQGPSTAFIRDCVVADAASTVLEALFRDSYIEARNVRITGKSIGPQPSTPIGLELKWYATVVGDSMVFRNCYNGIQAEGQSEVHLRNSQFVAWTNYAVKMLFYPGPEDIVLDLRNNYWGVTDSTAIAACVWDKADDRWDVAHGRVEFWPALDHPVPGRAVSFGGLKAPFLVKQAQ